MSSLKKYLNILPSELFDALEDSFLEILENFKQGRFEPSELNGGKFAEAVFRILEWHTDPSNIYTPIGIQIRNFKQSNKKFESLSNFPDSIRFHIPEIIVTMYTIRNKRGVGHLGGDVNPNFMDSTLILSLAKWALSELIRIFYTTTIKEAYSIVETINVKDLPVIWEVFGKKRVLDSKLSYKNKTLVLLYHEYPNPVTDSILMSWVEYSNPSSFKKNILAKLHKERFIEYDNDSKFISISPVGIKHVEENINLVLE